jgi:branched-chain amino acid transport system substrate-binding protein
VPTAPETPVRPTTSTTSETKVPGEVVTAPRLKPSTASQAAAAAPAALPVPVRSPVVLGSFGTASGVIGAQVAAIPPATRAWVADVNVRGGLSGHPVKVVFGDDRGDPQQALSLVRRMVEQDGAVAFVATYTVTTMDGVASYLEARNVPVIGATGGSEVEDTSPMIFNPTLGADQGIAWSYLLTIAAQTDKRKLSILYCREASTGQNQVGRIKELAPRLPGFSIVHEAQVSIVQPDYTAEVLAARNAGAEVVVTVMDAQSMIRVIRSAQRQSWKPIFSATHNLNSASFRTTDADLDGTLAASTTVPYTTSPRLAPYREAMQRYQPGAPLGGYGASAWAHALLVERLTVAWAREKPGSSDVLDALYGLRDETIGGLIVPITFNRGPHGAVNLCVVPLRYEGGMFRPPGGGDGTFTCPPGSRG